MKNKRNYEGEEKGNRNEQDKRMNRRRSASNKPEEYDNYSWIEGEG